MSRVLRSILALLLLRLAASAQAPAPQAPTQQTPATRDLYVTAGKSVIVDSPAPIQRIAVTNEAVASALATSPREVLINGKTPGETSLIIWQQNGQRQFFDVIVDRPNPRLEAVRSQLARELPGQDVTVVPDGDVVFVNGNVRELSSAERAVAIASVLGKPVNLLHVAVPPTEPQILIKIRFANVDRSVQRQLGLNLVSTGAANTIGSVTTGQFSPPVVKPGTTENTITISDALNLFFFRPDLNLAATIKALQSRNLLEILAEPNVLAINGHTANFIAGGEFPFPTLQGGGAGLGAVTIQFREFGVRIAFTPTITPRGTIRMSITPEVSALDAANGLVFQGFTIPALSTRRVQTAVELEPNQSFAIGGMLDNRVINNLSRIPGLGDIPIFGKLFRSQQLQKTNTELLVIVTPEIIRPMPADMPRPEINMPEKFLPPNTQALDATRTPGLAATGPVPNKPLEQTLPVEQLIRINQILQKQSQQSSESYQAAPLMQFIPMPVGGSAPAAPPPAATPPPQGTPRTGQQ